MSERFGKFPTFLNKYPPREPWEVHHSIRREQIVKIIRVERKEDCPDYCNNSSSCLVDGMGFVKCVGPDHSSCPLEEMPDIPDCDSCDERRGDPPDYSWRD